MNWTKKQEEAINTRGEILVAAAAGSGKTAVLVERNIRKIINEKVDINKILAITFTAAAASEMRERILSSLYKELEKSEDDNIKKQIRLLPKANISTIHSFCFNLIKENFFNLNLSSDVKVGQTEELELLIKEALDEILNIEYEKKDKNFLKLLNFYSGYRDDNLLRDEILKIHEFLTAIPFSEDWIKEVINKVSEKNIDYAKTAYGSIIFNEVKDIARANLSILKNEVENLKIYSELDKFLNVIYSDIDQIEKILKFDDWDKLYNYLQTVNFLRWPSLKGINIKTKDNAKVRRDLVKKEINKIKDIYIREKSESIIKDNLETISNIETIFSLVLKLDDKYKELKSKKNILDFTDLEKFALELLVEKKDNKYYRTEVAKEISKKYVEIQVDEYQDINKIQDLIIWSISNNNVFRVGDLKQSIYKFRNANPDIFIEKYSNFKEEEIKEEKDIKKEEIDNNEYTNYEDVKGTKILLYQNFRSRTNVIDFCNDLFSKIMSKELGEIEYNKEEYLNYSADFDDKDIKTEIAIISKDNIKTQNVIEKYLVDSDAYYLNIELEDINENEENNENQDNDEDNDFDFEIDEEETEKEKQKKEELKELIEDSQNIYLEAHYIAQKIDELIKSRFQIKTKEGLRNIQYKDIVILLRSGVGRTEVIEKVLYEKGIPVYADSSSNFFESSEILTVISLIKIIDNPLLDIDFTSILRSYFARFTLNEITEIRLINKDTSMYNAFLEYIEKTNNEKAIKFLSFLEDLKQIEKYLGVSEMLNKILIDSGYLNYISLENNGELKKANLKLFLKRAEEYEEIGNIGLHRFIKYLEKLETSSTDIASANIIGEKENVVRIMTIHSSKGLEFPIVFLSNADKKVNTQDLRENILLNIKYGVGIDYLDYKKLIKYPTLIKEAIKIKLKEELIAEEMRVLYVALTRAKEKLIITGTKKDGLKYIEEMKNLSQIYTYPSRYEVKYVLSPFVLKQKNSYLDWIMLSINIGLSNSEVKLISAKTLNLEEEEIKQEILKLNIEDFSEDIIELVNKKLKDLKFEYPHKEKSFTKVAASRIDVNKENIVEENIKNIEMQKPKFMKSKDLTKAEVGTITHFFLQKLEFNKIYSLEDLTKELDKLIKLELLTKEETETIDLNLILNFINSDEYKIILESKMEKEKQFVSKFTISEIQDIINIGENLQENNKNKEEKRKEDENNNETILVQGVIDLYYITKDNKLCILDYKTDDTYAETLIKRYRVQMLVYKRALEKALNKKVDKVLIYSITNNKYIEIKD